VKKYFVVVFLIFFIIVINAEKPENKSENFKIPDKTWGLQFGISENFNLESFGGGSISYINRYDRNKAISIQISFEIYNESATQRYLTRNLEQRNIYYGSSSDKLYDITLNPSHIFYYSTMSDRVNFYWGVGLLFIYSYSSGEQDTTQGDFVEYYIERSGAGARALLGIEWFVNNFISLNAEYSTDFKYVYEERKNKEETTTGILTSTSISSDIWDFNHNPVKFGVTV
jgi:hypothetical protein